MPRIKLGIWHGEIALEAQDRGDLPEGQVGVALDDRTLTVFAHREGSGFPHGSVRRSTEEQYDAGWEWRVYVPEVEGLSSLARCSLHTTTFFHNHRGILAYIIPLDHLLPWPKLRDCARYVQAEEALEDCHKRRDSALVAGVRFAAPPIWIQNVLTPAMRLELFEREVA